MTATTLKDLELKQLKASDTVTITEVPRDQWARIYDPVLIMGPTGAGKSSLLEALAGPKSSVRKLSSAGLEGYTQNVSAYKVEGLIGRRYRSSISLIDTPGFADVKISLVEIVSMIQKSVRECDSGILHILYVMPITNTRLSGTHSKVLRAFKEMTGTQSSGGITIVTTMWDTIHGVQAQSRAQRNFEQLQNDIWKDFIDRPGYASYNTEITKFVNTQASAVEILDLVYQRIPYNHFYFTKPSSRNPRTSKRNFALEIYGDLMERIEFLKMRKDNIISDSANLPSSENVDIRTILDSDLEQVSNLLTKFEQQREAFGIPRALQVTSCAPSNPSLASKSNGKSDFGQPESSGPKSLTDIQSQDVHRQTKKKGLMSQLKESTKHFVEKLQLTRSDHPGH